MLENKKHLYSFKSRVIYLKRRKNVLTIESKTTFLLLKF